MAPRRKNKGKPRKSKFNVKARSLRRDKPTRTEGRSILIVCEDSKASPDYFEKFCSEFRDELRLSSVNVEVCGKECGSAPMSVVSFAKERKRQVKASSIRDDYERVFCVIDIDDHPPTQIQSAIQKSRDNHIELIVSNPCFEYWYVLHFERIGSSFSSRPRLYEKLASLLGQDYDKSGCNFFHIFYPLTKTAIANSKGILSSQWQNEEDPQKCDPSTHVHRVVECIMDMAS